MSKRNGPSRAQLIHRLIEERAKVIRLVNPRLRGLPVCDNCRSQARREIEQEVLCPQR